MAVTRLQRKVLKRRAKAAQRKKDLKQLKARPVVRNVAIASLKAAFDSQKSK